MLMKEFVGFKIRLLHLPTDKNSKHTEFSIGTLEVKAK